MRGDAVARIHAKAQRLDAKAKLKSSVEVAASSFMEIAPKIDMGTEKFVVNIAKQVAKDVCSIFEYKGLPSVQIGTKIRSILQEDRKKSLWESLVKVMGASGIVATTVQTALDTRLTLLPALSRAIPPVVMGAAVKARLTHMSMIVMCLDVILVLERIYWFENSVINEESIEAACLYYVKVQPEVHRWIRKRFKKVLLDADYSERKVVNALQAAVNEFRFKPEAKAV